MNDRYVQPALNANIPLAATFWKCCSWLSAQRARMLAEEASQEAYCRSLTKQFVDQDHYNAWVTRTAINYAIDQIRKNRKQSSLVIKDVGLCESLGHLADLVEPLLSQLPRKQADVLRHYYIDNCNLDELADLHIPQDGSTDNARRLRVKRLKDKSLARLKQLLNEEGIDQQVLNDVAHRNSRELIQPDEQ